MKKVKKKSFFSSYLFLKIVFIILCFIVLGLLILIIYKKNTDNTIKSNMVISLINEDFDYDFSIDIDELRKQDFYVLKVVNYRGDNIISHDKVYNLSVYNEVGVGLSVFFNDLDDNLMVSQDGTVITDIGLKGLAKQEDFYYFKLDKGINNTKGKKIYVNITSNLE